MRIVITVWTLLSAAPCASAFGPTFLTSTSTSASSSGASRWNQEQCRSSSSGGASSTALFMGMNRKARRNQQKKQTANKSRNFYDAVKNLEDEKGSEQTIGNVKPVGIAEPSKQSGVMAEKEQDTENSKYIENEERAAKGVQQEDAVTSSGSVADALTLEKPEVSTVIVDEQTGFERIAQGKAVMDVVTRKAVKLSDMGPMYRMAQFSPGVAPDVRARHRLDWQTVKVPEIISSLRKACEISLEQEDKSVKQSLPPHPSVSNEGIDFVIANRDWLGQRLKKTLGRLKLRAQSQGDAEEAQELRNLWKHYMTLEDHISAPFRQMVLDAEAKVGPNFGNLDLGSYLGKELYERSASYVVLKAMVAHWEKKVRDADYLDKNPQTAANFMSHLATGDPKRYLPDPPILFKMDECVKVCAMAQQMTTEFVNNPDLFDDLPPELRFIEKALVLKSGTELRKYSIEEYCPAEDITPEALREGLRRFYHQMLQMQIDPYGDFTNLVGRLVEALSIGTPDDRDPYGDYLYNLKADFGSNPGFFQTYTFNEDSNSLVRFLDASITKKKGNVGGADDVASQLGKELSALFGGGPSKKDAKTEKAPSADAVYKVPESRGLGRPHAVGWLDLLEDDRVENKDIYESDNWREVNKPLQ